MDMSRFRPLFFNLPEPETEEEIAVCAYSDAVDDIAIALSEYQMKHGMTQTELAKKLGFSQSLLSGYENGSRNMTLETACNLMAKIGKRLSMNIEDALRNTTFQTNNIYSDEIEDDISNEVAIAA